MRTVLQQILVISEAGIGTEVFNTCIPEVDNLLTVPLHHPKYMHLKEDNIVSLLLGGSTIVSGTAIQ